MVWGDILVWERGAIRSGLNRISLVAVAALGGVALATPASAVPSSVTFDYNANNPVSVNNGISCAACNGGNSAAIASYMTQVLQNAGFVGATATVTGAVGQMGPASPSGGNTNTLTNYPTSGTNTTFNSYTGDGNAVDDPYHVRPLTLGDTEALPSATASGTYYDSMPAQATQWNAASGVPGTNLNSANDGYIKNCTGTDGANCTPTSDSFSIQFTTGGQKYLKDSTGKKYLVTSLSFDYEIFPDAGCTAGPAGGANCPDQPDLEVYANATGTGSPLVTYLGTAPSGTAYSPAGPNPETAFQAIGVSGVLSGFDPTQNAFDFVDWPATIGIDNLKIYTTQVPEPGTLILFGFGLLGVAGIARRRRVVSVG